MRTLQKGAGHMNWELDVIMAELAKKVENELRMARRTIGHGITLGEASQQVWLRLLSTYMPGRYCSRTAIVMDSYGNFSGEIDIVVFDRQYSPLLFEFEGATVVPVEAVYAVFEAKQELIGHNVVYAQDKAASVRRLKRTSIAIPTINGRFKKKPQRILAGIVALDSYTKDSLTGLLLPRLKAKDNRGLRKLDLGCVASLGTFGCGGDTSTQVTNESNAATSFLFELMSQLQSCGTAPAINFRAYAKWLKPAKQQKGVAAD